MSIRELLRWQWQGYPRYHHSRANLAVHILVVPLFLLVLGLERDVAAGTSMLVATVLTVTIMVTHLLVGDVAWLVAVPFAVGLVPATYLGGRLAPRLPTQRLQGAFGVLMIVLAGYLALRLTTG